MITIEALKQFGANTAEGMSRCLNKEAFYLRMVGLGLADKNYDKLGAAIAAGDVKQAFEAAHALKGVAGNLALTPLFQPLSELTELLRANGDMREAAALFGRVQEQMEKLRALNA